MWPVSSYNDFTYDKRSINMDELKMIQLIVLRYDENLSEQKKN
jgi:hypothetical protein